MKTAATSSTSLRSFSSLRSVSLPRTSKKVQPLPAALAFVGALTLNIGIAQAHIDLSEPPMRDGDQKAGPCEGEQRGEPREYAGGSTITLEWTETVDHGGSFLISLDLDGDDFDGDGDGEFDFPAAEGFEDSGNGNGDLVLLEVEDMGGSDFTAEVTLPDVACDNCTLQLIQNMAGNMPDDNDPTAHIYFRCADIVITSDNVGGGGAGAGGGGLGGGLSGGFGGEIFGGAGGDVATSGGGGGAPFPMMGGTGGTDRPAPEPVVPPAGTTPPAVTTPVTPLPMPSSPAPTVTTNPGLIAPPPMSGAPAVTPNPSPPPAGTATGSPSAAPSTSSSAMGSDSSGDDSSCSMSVAPRSAAWSLLLAFGAMLTLSRRRRMR